MPAKQDSLSEKLARFHEIKITVTGRKSGNKISIPVWFVSEGDTVYLLPVQGSQTQWYKNLLEKPEMHIDARGTGGDFKIKPITDAAQVKPVVEKFRAKYGAGDVKKYYSNFDVAVVAEQ